MECSAEVKWEYRWNVFLLEPDDMRDLEENVPAASVTGRFRHMRSADDGILRARLRTALQWGKRRERIRLALAGRHSAYLLNRRCSRFDLEGSLAFPLARSTRLTLEGFADIDHFRRNAVADAVDEDRDGVITKEEKRYRARIFTEWGGEVRAEWRFGKGGRPRLDVFAGLSGRNYRSPFEGQREAGPECGMQLRFRPAGPLDARVGWRLGWRNNPPHRRVLILDEWRFGTDFNGDGDAEDIDIRTIQREDRSTIRPLLETQLGWGTRKLRWQLEGAFRVRKFLSREPFDRQNRDRLNFRITLRLTVRIEVAQGFHLHLGAWGCLQRTSGESTGGDFQMDYINGGGFLESEMRFG
ncbi:MAG: hypothetical protein ACYTHN_09310 [Planctomycetota bacterium]